MEFEPAWYDGEKWDCLLAAEWLTWPVHQYGDLDGMSLQNLRTPDLVECSFYFLARHHPARLRHFLLRKCGSAIFEADFSAIAEVDDGSKVQSVEISGKCDLKFSGIIVVPDNLFPKPTTVEAVRAAVTDFIDMEGLREPRSEQWRYIFEPAS